MSLLRRPHRYTIGEWMMFDRRHPTISRSSNGPRFQRCPSISALGLFHGTRPRQVPLIVDIVLWTKICLLHLNQLSLWPVYIRLHQVMINDTVCLNTLTLSISLQCFSEPGSSSATSRTFGIHWEARILYWTTGKGVPILSGITNILKAINSDLNCCTLSRKSYQHCWRRWKM